MWLDTLEKKNIQTPTLLNLPHLVLLLFLSLFSGRFLIVHPKGPTAQNVKRQLLQKEKVFVSCCENGVPVQTADSLRCIDSTELGSMRSQLKRF